MTEPVPSKRWQIPRNVPLWSYYLGVAGAWISGYALGAWVYGS